MITAKDVNKIVGLPFEDYLKLQGFSNSFLKSEVGGVTPDFTPTEKVLKGKALDALLTNEPLENSEYYSQMITLRGVIKTNYPFILKAETQVSYTCKLCFEGFEMPFKGRLDFELGNAVIDLKYTEERQKNFNNLIEFMGYKNQVWAYAKAANKTKAYILMVNNKKEHQFIEINLSERNAFYENQIINFGNYAN